MNKFYFLILLSSSISFSQINNNEKSIFLEDISWSEAEKFLTPDAIILIPLGAAAKEHGRHLPLAADYMQAEYLKDQIAGRRKLVVAPTINYSFYPPFLKYAGSTSLRFTTARDMVLEIVRQLAAYGPKKFYVINVGLTTNAPLANAAKILADEGILLFFSDYTKFTTVEEQVRTIKTGTHADEIETSNLLFIAQDKVEMNKAVDDTTAVKGGLSLTRIPAENGSISVSGVYGYATLATKEKGEKSMLLIEQAMLRDIDSLRAANLPVAEDQSELLSIYAGEYQTSDNKKLLIKVSGSYLDFSWLERDHSNFYHLYYYSKDFYASQVMDIFFLRNGNEIEKAVCSYRGERFELIKVK